MSQHLEGMMDVTLDKIKGMVDANLIIGTPVTSADGTVVLPVSKVTFGFASGGSDFPNKAAKELFGGGGGAGVTIQPVAFLVMRDGEVSVRQLADTTNNLDRALSLVPELVDKVTALLAKGKEKEPSAQTGKES